MDRLGFVGNSAVSSLESWSLPVLSLLTCLYLKPLSVRLGQVAKRGVRVLGPTL